MRRLTSIAVLALGFSALPLALHAQEEATVEAEGDATMEMTGDDAATSEEALLSLPEEADEQGRENAADGVSTADEARDRGREFGQSRAEEARPDEAGRPDDAGRPEGADRPDEADRADTIGRPEDAGRPDDAGRSE